MPECSCIHQYRDLIPWPNAHFLKFCVQKNPPKSVSNIFVFCDEDCGTPQYTLWGAPLHWNMNWVPVQRCQLFIWLGVKLCLFSRKRVLFKSIRGCLFFKPIYSVPQKILFRGKIGCKDYVRFLLGVSFLDRANLI